MLCVILADLLASEYPNISAFVDSNKARFAIWALSLVNFGLAAMMGALGVLTLINLDNAGNRLSTAFLSSYMIVFAAVLFCYELIWWTPLPALNKAFRKNFGFLYGLKGKGFYLIFIAFLCLGLRDNNASGVKGLDLATGIAWLAAGIFHLFISCTWDEADNAYKPPTAGLENLGEDGQQQQNPV